MFGATREGLAHLAALSDGDGALADSSDPLPRLLVDGIRELHRNGDGLAFVVALVPGQQHLALSVTDELDLVLQHGGLLLHILYTDCRRVVRRNSASAKRHHRPY
jgi:hypothetical protein